MSGEHNAVGWFEIPVTDMERAKAFYEHVFQVKLEDLRMGESDMALFPMKENVIGSAGSLSKGTGYTPSREGVLIYFTAPDIPATLARAKDKGGEVLLEKTSIGAEGFIAYLRDTEGNRIALHSRQ